MKPLILRQPEVRQALETGKVTVRREIKCSALEKVVPHPDSSFYIDIIKYSPFGQPGDRFYCRETWQLNPYGGIVYRAGSGIVDCDGRGWRSPVTMPRWASRLTLETVSSTVEQNDGWEWVGEMRRVDND